MGLIARGGAFRAFQTRTFTGLRVTLEDAARRALVPALSSQELRGPLHAALVPARARSVSNATSVSLLKRQQTVKKRRRGRKEKEKTAERVKTMGRQYAKKSIVPNDGL